MITHASAHWGCTDTITESALKADSGRKISCCTRDSILCRYYSYSTKWAISIQLDCKIWLYWVISHPLKVFSYSCYALFQLSHSCFKCILTMSSDPWLLSLYYFSTRKSVWVCMWGRGGGGMYVQSYIHLCTFICVLYIVCVCVEMHASVGLCKQPRFLQERLSVLSKAKQVLDFNTLLIMQGHLRTITMS